MDIHPVGEVAIEKNQFLNHIQSFTFTHSLLDHSIELI